MGKKTCIAKQTLQSSRVMPQ